MTIDVGTDRAGTSLRMLVWQALQSYSVSALIPFLDDLDPVVRTAAARQLQIKGSKAVFDHALSLASSRAESKKEIAAFILGQIGAPEFPFRQKSLPVLARLCSDRSPLVREAALTAIGHLGATELIDIVWSRKKDEDKSVRSAARFVERQLKG